MRKRYVTVTWSKADKPQKGDRCKVQLSFDRRVHTYTVTNYDEVNRWADISRKGRACGFGKLLTESEWDGMTARREVF